MSIKLYDAEIEYLESDGNAYIDTGIIGSQNTDYEVKTMFTKNTSYPYIFGAQQANKKRRFSLMEGSYRTFYYIANDDTLETNISLSSAEQTGINIIKKIGRKVYVNNSLKVTWAATDYTTTATITLYAVNSAGGVGESNRFRNGKIYYIKFYESNVLVRDFIPVRVGNVGYLFDKVSMKLFGNSGTGSFVLGSDVSYDVPEANEVAFLESWGNQYIDTGIKPSTDTKIELKCLYCKSGAGLTSYGSLIGADDRSNAYILNHSAVANFTYGLEFSNNFANPQTRLLTFDSTASPQHMRVYDEGGSLVTTLTCIRGVFEVNQNLYLFAVNRNGTPVYGSNRILYCKIYDGDTLVRDYVPVEYNGEGLLYDRVSKYLFSNEGTGKFIYGNIALPSAKFYIRRNLIYKAPKPWDILYLTFKALASGTFSLSTNNVYYSLDEGASWKLLNAGTLSPVVTAGQTIMWKATLTPAASSTGIGTFSATANFEVKGNPLSLIFGDNFIGKKSLSGKNHAFSRLFRGNTKVKDASELYLVATTLGNYCYDSMFYGCTGLVHSPKVLPANNTGHSGYGAMFYNCTSLVDSPDIKATVAGNSALASMFWNCTSLITSPPKLPSTLNSYCFRHMFYGCKNMVTTPILPATTLVSQCYVNLFNGCKKVNYIKAMFTTAPTTDRTGNWVSNVAATGTFVKNSAATWDVTGTYGVPSGWTVETASS